MIPKISSFQQVNELLYSFCTKISKSSVILAIPALWRLRQEDEEFKGSLGYIARPCLKKQQNYSKNKLILKSVY
jgi:hypothetical protein